MQFVATLLIVTGGSAVLILFLGWALKPRRSSTRSSRQFFR